MFSAPSPSALAGVWVSDWAVTARSPCRYPPGTPINRVGHRRNGPFWLCGHSLLPLVCWFQPHNAQPKSALGKEDIREANFCIPKARWPP
jgi:hypothetical protein